MRQWGWSAFGVLMGLVGIFTLAMSFAFRFEHPEKTQTQIFLEIWWVYLIALLAWSSVGMAIYKTSKD